MNMKSKLIPIVLGALGTLTMGAITLVVLPALYRGNIPSLPAVLAALLCSVIGGYLATRLAKMRGLATGALSGVVAGVVVLLIAAAVTGLAANSTLAAILVIPAWAAGGALGGWLTRVRLSLTTNESSV